jgi:hypothetical protein
MGSLAQYFSTMQKRIMSSTPADIERIGNRSDRALALVKKSKERSNATIAVERHNDPRKSMRLNFAHFVWSTWAGCFGSFNCHATRTKASIAMGHSK